MHRKFETHLLVPALAGLLLSVAILPSVYPRQAGHETITPAKKASSDAQAKILKLQLQASRIQTQYQACQAQDFQTQFNKTSVEIIQASDEALKEAKLDKKEWDLNLETFEFIKRPPAVAEKK